MAMQIARARELHASGIRVTESIPQQPAVCVRTMAGIYLGILDRIEAAPELPLRGRARLSTAAKLERDGALVAGGGMTRQPRVAVVGAGLAGLTAGLALARRGWRVDLYERSRLLGGKTTSFEVDGHEVDCGQHVVLACCTATLELIDELGLTDSLYVQPRFEVTVLSRSRPPAHLRAS